MNAVELSAVNQHYGPAQVLHDVSLSLGEGEVLGLFGHNGAGKTTTIKLILGLLQASAGSVRVLGHDPHSAEVRRALGYLPENVSFYAQLSGRETLQHFARLKRAPLRQCDDLLEQVGLSDAANRRVKTYSKGMRQRLGLAQALLGEPRLLLLDEPTVGLDPIATQSLYQLIDQLRQHGTSIILCSHVLPGVERHIDRAAILAHGRLQALGDIPSLRERAGLPIRIRLHDEQARGLQHWQAQGFNTRAINGGHWFEVSTAHASKLGVLRQLLAENAVSDVELHQPSLEDLYCHFMQQAAAGGAQ
ncbi:ABC transporter ATP-binding protein [Atopomonas sediminilitoris]|uniref:ABC transporter ATP-binding protein n=1 Tax=Atopomonas sediminilitoris TaxID=2919919 RepID=UPI001F4DB419|nr:ABC transporter ATP-binding protein [Atopomonas sediminilitoris]MCJ8168140.1 ABC transporter ATP-binding protein [Atopomonas sediminilitoris]